jgi:curved DNA-binding protein CbpA
MTPTADHYETLQVSPRADRDTIERVFRLLAKRYHPDKNGTVAITAGGVDRVLEGEPRPGVPTLKALTEHPAPRAAAG